MANTNRRKHICTGLMAHVDSGKTTLSEALLYTSGAIRKLGKVDTKDAFLDTDERERARGITNFFQTGGTDLARHGSDIIRYTGACGFFCGDGACASGAGLRSAADQWIRWCAGTYADAVESVAAV